MMKKLSIVMSLFLAVLALTGCKEKNVPDTDPGADVSTGELTGVFTVSGEGDKVVFAQGNLQYQATTNTWRFAENQYDAIGDANSHIAADYAGWIDLFGFGTGSNPIFTSTVNADYTTFVDWGTNAISNGGNKPNTWRTLTADEWNYLVYGRSDDTRGSATVNGVHGYIFLPDDWTLPDGLTFTTSPNNWSVNVYSIAEWKTLEKTGAVFFPASGYREGTELHEVGEAGEYWSSTPSYTENATRMTFSSGSTNTGVYGRCIGRAVRLVKNIKDN